MTATVTIELVFVTPEAEVLRSLEVPSTATVADAILQAGLADEFPDYPVTELPAGIWGRPVERDQTVKDGDRVEVYREPLLDPMEARRLRASAPDPDPCESP